MKHVITQIMIFFVVLFLFNGCGCNNTNYSVAPLDSLPSLLQFDGVYQSEKVDNEYWHYFRFYEDRTVITASSTGTPEQIASWFKKENIENRNLSHGKFENAKNKLTFSSTSENGTVDYDGELEDNTLTINSYSHITEIRSNRICTFVKLSE